MIKNKPLLLYRPFMTLLELLIGMALAMVLLTTLTFFYQQIDQMNTLSEKKQKEIFHLQYAENRLNQVIPQALAEATNGLKFFTSGNLSGLLSEGNPSLVFQYETGTDLDNERAGTALARLFVDKENRLCLATWPDPSEWEKQLTPLKARIEILLENVSSLKFQFFIAPERDRSLVTGKNVPGTESTAPAAQEKQNQENPKGATGSDRQAQRTPPNRQNAAPQEKNKPSENTPSAEPTPPPGSAGEGEISLGQGPELKGVWVKEWNRDYKQLPSLIKIEITQAGKESAYVFAFPFLKSKDVIVYEQ